MNHYVFHFFDNTTNNRTIVKTSFVVGTISLENLLKSVQPYSQQVPSKVYYALLKEFADYGGGNTREAPAKVERQHPQAFILKRAGDVISNKGGTYFINEMELNQDFEVYDVNIVEINR
jgi:hypothetical protein